MKLIINISEETYIKANAGILGSFGEIIANGTPYEEGKKLARPHGKWIRKVDKVGFVSHICSECGAEIELEDCSDDKFCFNCGADMREGVYNGEK